MQNPHAQWTEDDFAGHGAKLRSLALRLVADESTADDLAQEAWIVLQRRGEVGIQDFGAFFRGVLRHLSSRRRVSEQRRLRREQSVAREEAVPSARDLDDTLVAQHALIEELEQLPDELRELLLLRYYEGLSGSEIARQCGLPASTVRSRLARGVTELRERLDRRHAGRRELWAMALLRVPTRGGLSVTAGSTFLGVISMSIALKCTLVVALAATGIFFWPTEDASTSLELAQSTEAEAQTEPDSVERGASPIEALAVGQERVPTQKADLTVGGEIPRRTIRVVDRATGVPAPAYNLEVKDEAGEMTAFTTDLNGEFELTDETDRWNFELLGIDEFGAVSDRQDRWSIAEAARRDADATLLFEVELGPTYRIQLPAGTPSGVLHAQLSNQGFSPNDAGPSGSRTALVRRADQPWVRFRPDAARPELLGRGPWFLRVSDGNGIWQVWGEVDSIEGEHARIVTLSGPPFGCAEVNLRIDGAPCTSGLLLHLQPSAANDTWSMGVRSQNSGSGLSPVPGRVTFRYLPVGEYIVSVSDKDFERTRAPFVVSEGETTSSTLEVRKKTVVDELIVVLQSESGDINFAYSKVDLRATQPDQKAVQRGTPSSKAPTGEAHFHFSNLGTEAWRLDLSSVSHLPSFDLEEGMLVTADMGEVRLTCLDKSGEDMLEQQVRVIEAGTGQDVRLTGVTFWVEGEAFLSTTLTAGPQSLPRMRHGTLVDCLVQAPGYRPLLLENVSYPLELGGGEVGEFVLEPGWGLMFVAHELDGELPFLEGVEALLGGRSVGSTDSRGRVVVEADEEPTSIELKHPDYEHVIGGIDPATKKLRSPGAVWASHEMFRKR
jgi:RNA polymerase sigma factor (sigma-70 family)